MTISFVAAGTAFTAFASSTAFTLNAPAGIQAGDLLLAAVGVSSNTTTTLATPPSGWTLLGNTWAPQATAFTIATTFMYRVCDGTEGASWAGTLTAAKQSKCAAVSAYRASTGRCRPIRTNIEGGTNSGGYKAANIYNPNHTGNWAVAFISANTAASSNIGHSGTMATPRWGTNGINPTSLGADSNNCALSSADSNGAVTAATTISGAYTFSAAPDNTLYQTVIIHESPLPQPLIVQQQAFMTADW